MISSNICYYSLLFPKIIQTVLIQSILIGKESQKKNLPFGHCSIWAGYKALQSTKYKTTNCAQECTQPSAQYDVQTDLTKDSIALAHFPGWLQYNPVHMSSGHCPLRKLQSQMRVPSKLKKQGQQSNPKLVLSKMKDIRRIKIFVSSDTGILQNL